MKRKLLAFFVAAALAVSTITAVSSEEVVFTPIKEVVTLSDGKDVSITISSVNEEWGAFDGVADAVAITIANQGITDEQLVELIESGAIPSDVSYLDLRKNQITVVSPLAELKQLEWLNLCDNEITDFSDLRNYRGFLSAGNGKVYDEDDYTELFKDYVGYLNGKSEEPWLNDALQILRYTVNLLSILDESDYAFAAACIVSENEPGLADALQIMRYCVKMPSVFDE